LTARMAAKSALATGFRTGLQGPESAGFQVTAAWFPVSFRGARPREPGISLHDLGISGSMLRITPE
jgi:hypothetical protein